MPQDVVTFRPRGGATYTLGAGITESVPIPSGTAVIHIVCTLSPGRVGVGTAEAAPALADSSYGYLAANIPMTVKVVGGRESRLYLGSGIADNIFYVTFGN